MLQSSDAKERGNYDAKFGFLLIVLEDDAASSDLELV